MMPSGEDRIELFSIVVLGHMNPSIHHPLWYESVQLLTRRERELACDSPEFLCLPVLAQFQLEDFGLTCTMDRWEIKTTKSAVLDRVLHLTSVVFEKLDQTPVSAFGFNFNCHERTQIHNVAELLAHKLSALTVDLRAEAEQSGEFTLRWHSADRRVSIVVQPSQMAPDMVAVANNFHYNIKDLVAGQQHFELGVLLSEHCAADRRAAEELKTRVVESLSQTTEVGHAASD